jgi:hypothetical protein
MCIQAEIPGFQPSARTQNPQRTLERQPKRVCGEAAERNLTAHLGVGGGRYEPAMNSSSWVRATSSGSCFGGLFIR